MPLHKNPPLVRQSSRGSNTQLASGTGFPSQSPSPSNTDKSSHAARMAQQLASQSSWADTYVPTPPPTSGTPTESVVDTQSQMDDFDAPPSYEAASLGRELPPIPQTRDENVRQEPSYSISASALDPVRDMEPGATTPLLCQDQDMVRARKQKQRRFIVVFFILAVWLMGVQAIKGFGIGFWRADGTPMPPLPQRNYTRHETSHSISGTFTFYDALDLSTTSGSINIVIDPQPSDKVGVIRISSRSGSIKVRFTDEYMKGLAASGILDRVYDFEIRSSSASQTVELPQGNGGRTTLTTESGSISAAFQMTHLGKSPDLTRLSTQSSSGSQTIKYRSTSSNPITSLAATHYSTGSASIKVYLPTAWEGMVHASSGGSGSVDVKGEGLQYQRNGTKEIYAWRVRGGDSKRGNRDGQVVEVRGDGSGTIKVDCSAS